MVVKVSNVMCKHIKEHIKSKGYDCALVKMEMRDFELNVDGNVWENDVDWVLGESKFKVLRIDYPAEYYAIPKYLTTNDLRRICRRGGCVKLSELLDKIWEEIEI